MYSRLFCLKLFWHVYAPPPPPSGGFVNAVNGPALHQKAFFVPLYTIYLLKNICQKTCVMASVKNSLVTMAHATFF